jgi:hypothetical protein
MSKLWKKIRQAVPSLRKEQGQAYIEVLLVLPLFIVFIVGVTYFGRAWYAKIAAEMAAYDGGYMPGGCQQGIIAARQTLAGFYMNPANADVRVVPLDVWGRGQAVRCDVRYKVDLSGVPLIEMIGANPTLPVWARAVGQVEAYKSEW